MKQLWALQNNSSNRGFTIVELLIVIVVIGILAAITIVAFNGIQNRAYDTSVQNDLTNVGKKILAFKALNDRWPQGGTDLSTMDLRVSKGAYSQGINVSGAWYNFVYCWPGAATPDAFALVAISKSGALFENRNGKVQRVSYAFTGSGNGCASAGVTLDSGTSRDWLYQADEWRTFVQG